MNNLLLFGAGRSSLYLIEYLQRWCANNQHTLLVCDKDTRYAKHNIKDHNGISFIELDIFDHGKIEQLVKDCRMVISLLPAALHIHIARLCLSYKKNLGTASYISDEMKELHEEAKSKDLIFLNECGLDPGIDHMSAMQMMDGIRNAGGEITCFESYCGGLVANESDGDNPWKYKFTWNPRNVVLAGQGAPALFMKDHHLKVVPYQRLFSHTERFEIKDSGIYEAYPNRDSLKYSQLYNLQNTATMIRGTLRKQGYAKAWQVLVSLGLTDDTTVLHLKQGTSMKEWLISYLPAGNTNLEEEIKHVTHCGEEEIAKLAWLGFFTDEPLPLTNGTSAQILEEVLKTRWKLEANDKDLVVMLHKIGYRQDGKDGFKVASMSLVGDTDTHTAMAKTVGLPLAIACRLMLEDKITARGVIAPVTAEFYDPVLEELEGFGIRF